VVSGKNGTGKNSTGNNGTNGKLSKNVTFSIFYNISIVDLSWGLGVQDEGLEVWVRENLTPMCDFYLCHFYLK